MAEAAGIRVVRCPQCDKLLPELPNYSVYVCGGCGATLQAKKNAAFECSSEDTDGETVKYLEVMENATGRRKAVNFCIAEGDVKERSTYGRRDEQLPGGSRGDGLRSIPEQNESDGSGRKAELKYSRQGSGTGYFDRVESASRERRVREQTGKNAMATNSDLSRAHGLERKEVKDGAMHNNAAANGEVRSRRTVGLRGRMNQQPLAEAVNPNLFRDDDSPRNRAKFTPSSFAGNSKHSKGRDIDGPARIGNLEKDRAVLLRMLNELRDQVEQQSSEDARKRSKSTPVRRAAENSSCCSPQEFIRHMPPQQSSLLDRNASRYSSSLMNGYHAPGIPEHHSMIPAQRVHGCRGYHPPSYDTSFYGPCDPDPFISYHHEGFYHQPACSCLHCFHNDFVPHPQRAPRAFDLRRIPYHVNESLAYPSAVSRHGGHSVRSTTHPYQNHQRPMRSKARDRMCQPIAGAAPFTVCCSCYELLRLPTGSSCLNKSEVELRCGSCCHTNAVNLHRDTLDVLPLTSQLSSGSKVDSDLSKKAHSLESIDGHGSQEKDTDANCSEPENMPDLSSSSTMSAEGESPGSSSSQKDCVFPPGAEVSARVRSLPLVEHMALSDRNTDSAWPEEEKLVLLTECFKQNSLKDVPVATETDLHCDDPLQQKFDIEHDALHKNPKSSNSFLGTLIKRRFRSSHAGGRGGRVTVNGYPIAYRAVRKAEKLAGPISPGQYWYDYRAGFWGVIGQPCLGMIPPFIPEFNCPMPRNCSGGNSGVIVNGRELHKKDLDLLASRGLPETPGRSYRIDISGRVWDESGEELPNLGRLAPTVEKMRHGFGMQVPSVAEW